MEKLPVEILEKIFGYLESVVDQVNLCLVCRLWCSVVLDLRSFARQTHRTHCPTLDRHVFKRLPVAGSLNEGHGNEGFAVMFNLKISQPIFFCGATIFLPHPDYLKLRKTTDKLNIVIKLNEHATSQIGPTGN